ncbi:MAG TPA: hypothetical protein VJK00_03040, partial [Steroidobacteraceae bacterium]|nr:hypothetical protein [Steroidobacteraceae bacterium]
MIKAVLPASFRSMVYPARTKASDYDGHARDRQLARGFDQTANSLAMTDLRAKPEIARGRFNVERPAISSRPAGIDFDAYGLAGGCCRSSDVVRRDLLRMRDEITELLAAFCIAGLH